MNKKEFKEYATNLLLKKCGCKKLYDLDTSVQKKDWVHVLEVIKLRQLV